MKYNKFLSLNELYKIIKPIKVDLNPQNSIRLLLFLYCIHRPYLVSYSIVYKILKHFFFNKSEVNYKIVPIQFTVLVILLLTSYLVGYIIGLPLKVLRDSYR